MSACCDGNRPDCPCECHGFDPVMSGITARLEDRIRALVARYFGPEPQVHPLLDPGATPPAPGAPPVDPARVRYPLKEVRAGGRVIGYAERAVVTITDEVAMRMIDSGAVLGVSIEPLRPDWSAVDSWLGEAGPRPPVVSPDCRDENHGKCNGDAWDLEADQVTGCQCPCHG